MAVRLYLISVVATLAAFGCLVTPAIPEGGGFATSEEPGEEPGEESGDLPLPDNDAVLVDEALPQTLVCGDVNTTSIVMYNNGISTWTREGGYKLAALGNSDPLYQQGVRIWLPEGASVAPGGDGNFQFDVVGPHLPGAYFTDWQMILEDVELFGGTVSATVQVSCDFGGDSGGGGVNQCDGEMDQSSQEVLSLQGTSAEESLFACGFGQCVGSLQSGESKECLLACVQTATEYSSGCAGC
jgi:hypothetical protein